jgi:hypothetical protein
LESAGKRIPQNKKTKKRNKNLLIVLLLALIAIKYIIRTIPIETDGCPFFVPPAARGSFEKPPLDPTKLLIKVFGGAGTFFLKKGSCPPEAYKQCCSAPRGIAKLTVSLYNMIYSVVDLK